MRRSPAPVKRSRLPPRTGRLSLACAAGSIGWHGFAYCRRWPVSPGRRPSRQSRRSRLSRPRRHSRHARLGSLQAAPRPLPPSRSRLAGPMDRRSAQAKPLCPSHGTPEQGSSMATPAEPGPYSRTAHHGVQGALGGRVEPRNRFHCGARGLARPLTTTRLHFDPWARPPRRSLHRSAVSRRI